MTYVVAMKKLSTRQKFNEPAASSVGDVPLEGKEAMQKASFNVQHAGLNPYRHRRSSSSISPKVSAGGAVGFLQLVSSQPRPTARNIRPGYFRSLAAPAPNFFGAKAA